MLQIAPTATNHLEPVELLHPHLGYFVRLKIVRRDIRWSREVWGGTWLFRYSHQVQLIQFKERFESESSTMERAANVLYIYFIFCIII